MLCHVCEINRKEDLHFSMKPKRSLQINKELVHECLRDGGVALQRLKLVNEFAWLPLQPIFVEFSLATAYSTVDVYSDFRFEPMHKLSLGISRLLKECI